MNVTPHDIAQLAQTRRRDPELAMRIAEQSAAQSAASQSTQVGKAPIMASQRVA